MADEHTPGPWSYIRDGDYWEIKPTGIGGKDNYEGNEADYRLTAAAPTLLFATESAKAWLDNWAQHVGTCPDGQVCTCGLDAIRNELAIALQPLT